MVHRTTKLISSGEMLLPLGKRARITEDDRDDVNCFLTASWYNNQLQDRHLGQLPNGNGVIKADYIVGGTNLVSLCVADAPTIPSYAGPGCDVGEPAGRTLLS
jgi:hypothetical protein